MNRNANIYQDEHTGGWICEVLLYPRDPRPEWCRLGIFGTRAAAVAAAIDLADDLRRAARE